MKKILILAALAIGIAGPAHADPISAIAGVFTAMGAAAATATVLAQLTFGFGLSTFLSIAGRAMMDKPTIEVKFDVQFGDDAPLSFTAGDYVTAGNLKYIGSWGRNTRFVTEVLEYSALPQGLAAFWVNDEAGEYVVPERHWGIRPDDNPNTIGNQGEYAPGELPSGWLNVGRAVKNLQDDGNRIYIKVVPGTQVAADPFLRWVFGAREGKEITANFIGRGKSYVIVTTRYDSETLTSKPTYLWQPEPLPMYDPRLDSTSGGSGPHRWGDRSTYAPTRNPAVIAYNITRGIYFGSEWIFGGRDLPAWRLPLAEWFAAMNACAATVALEGGGTEPAYRCGLQISADMTAADVLEEIGRAANMRFAEVGGRLKPIVGLPGAAVFAMTDESILITEGQSYKPFNGLGDTFNALSATYPEPVEKWSSKDAPEYIDADATAEDGGRYLPTSISYPAAPYRNQVQRLMRAQMRDYRRMRLHQFYLPPEAYALEPLVDMVSWTSARNGYVNKLFVVERVDPTPGMNVLVTLREVDPSDYDWQSDYELPKNVVVPPPPEVYVQAVPDLAVTGVIIEDGDGRPRRPAIRVTCSPDEAGVTAIQIRARMTAVADPDESMIDTTRPYQAPHRWHLMDVIPATGYEVQARLISSIATRSQWSVWMPVTTPDVRLGVEDLKDDILGDLGDFTDELDRIDGELSALKDQVDDVINPAVAGLTDDLAALELDLQNGLASVDGRIETGIDEYDLIVQGQFEAVAGQIAELTAALTSESLIENGSFVDGGASWTASNATFLVRDGSPDALVAAAPDTHMAAVGQGAPGSLVQPIAQFEAGENDKLQVRFSAATSISSRIIRASVHFEDVNGDPIGSAVSTDITVSPANTWRGYSAQFDIPPGAVTGALTLTKTQGSVSVLLTKASVELVDVAIIARVTALEVAQATSEAAFAAYQTTAAAQFGTLDGRITTEAATRATADSAMSARIDTVEATAGTNSANISTITATVATVEQSVASVNDRLTVQFGSTQLVRDPGFSNNLSHWQGSLGSLSDIIARNTAPAAANVQKTMPEPRAFGIGAGDAGTAARFTPWMDISPDEGLTLSASFYRQANAPAGRVAVQYLDDAGTIIGASPSIVGSTIGRWHNVSRADIVPPSNAVQARVTFWRGAGGTEGALDRLFITGLRLSRQVGYEALSQAEVVSLKAAQASADLAFSSYVAGANSRFAAVESDTAAIASSLSTFQTKTDADAAIGLLRDEVNAQYGRISASGRLRITSVAAATGSVSRVALMAEATASSTSSTAAMFLSAASNGDNWVTFVANRFAIVTGTGANAPQTVPFFVQGGSVYLSNPLIAPNAISEMVNMTRQTLVDPGHGLGKWAYQYPPNAAPSGQPNPAENRATYSDYLTATISASVQYDLYFWISISGGDIVANVFRNSATQPYGGFVHRTVLDSHTRYSYNSGSIVGVVPQVTGTQSITLAVAGIHGSVWTAAVNASITLMALQK